METLFGFMFALKKKVSDNNTPKTPHKVALKSDCSLTLKYLHSITFREESGSPGGQSCYRRGDKRQLGLGITILIHVMSSPVLFSAHFLRNKLVMCRS